MSLYYVGKSRFLAFSQPCRGLKLVFYDPSDLSLRILRFEHGADVAKFCRDNFVFCADMYERAVCIYPSEDTLYYYSNEVLFTNYRNANGVYYRFVLADGRLYVITKKELGGMLGTEHIHSVLWAGNGEFYVVYDENECRKIPLSVMNVAGNVSFSKMFKEILFR